MEGEGLNLSRKYRPRNMAEYIGNDKLKETIMNRLAKEVRPQTILLKGSTGGGKTTMARLIAKEYLCEDRDVEKGACGVCANCESIEDYIQTGNTDELMNIKEVNASRDNGVAKINALLEDAEQPSFDGSWKVYILDECHQISRAAQNSLLKQVEEPNEKILFIFCTTDPEQMLETLLNRCSTTLDVKKPQENELANVLNYICMREDIESDKRGLSLIVDRSELVLRKAIMDLETVIAVRGSATVDSVLHVFDSKPNSLYFEFYDCLLNHDTHRYVSVLHKVKSTESVKEFVRNLTNFTKRGIYIYNGVNIEGITKNEMKNMKELFTRLSIMEQGQMLQFLTEVEQGDVETNLLLLGFKGLKTFETLEDEETLIMESPQDLEVEKKVMVENKKASVERVREQAKTDIQTELSPMSMEDALDMFN